MSNTREQTLNELGLELRKSSVEGVFLLQAVADQSGLNLTDLQCVYILTLTGPITAGQLADITGLTTGAVTGVINRMEGAGYVTRTKDPADGRRVVVRPVAEALERVGVGFMTHTRALNELLGGYDDRDLGVLLEVMRGTNAITQEEILRLRSAHPTNAKAPAAIGTIQQARLTFDRGASKVKLHADSTLSELYQASFEGMQPRVTEENGNVTVSYIKRFANFFDWRNPSAEIRLNPAVPWVIELLLGTSDIEADLQDLKLTSFKLDSGLNNARLVLPKPIGVVPIRLTGGANNVSIKRPTGVQVRFTLKGGGAKLIFDDQTFEGGIGGLKLQTPGFAAATEYYDIEVTGGANQVSIT